MQGTGQNQGSRRFWASWAEECHEARNFAENVRLGRIEPFCYFYAPP